MNFIYDAILESNRLEDDAIKERCTAKPPKLKGIQECKDLEATLKEECEDKELNEDVLHEDKLVDVEDFLEPENYMESMEKEEDIRDNLIESKQKIVECDLPNRPTKGRPGSPEYDSNENRRKRVARYRKNANLDESFNITESNINNWALTRTCTQMNCPKDRLKAELLRQPYTGLERYDED